MTETPPLTCGVCGREAAADVICHHCGRPLCTQCRLEWPDTAFPGRTALGYAFHCNACWQRYHFSVSDIFSLTRSYVLVSLHRVNRLLRRGR